MKIRIALALVSMLAVTSQGFAQQATAKTPDTSAPQQADQPKPNDSSPQLAAIRAQSEAFVEAFNKADAAAVASLWTEDGEYVDDTGATFTGRKAIEQAYADFFADNANAKIQINIDSLRLLSPTTAMEEGRSLVHVPPASTTMGQYTAIHVQVDGKWKMASVRDALIDVALAEQNAHDLDWLIGTWVAEEQGNKYESVCSWVCDKRFVQRVFTTTFLDGTQSSGVQMIGWNPQASHVQSWTFSPDGGHAVGVWTPAEGGWVAQMRGMTGAGIPTASTNLLQRLDDNAYAWQSVNRTADGVAIPDTDEVVLKRQPATK